MRKFLIGFLAVVFAVWAGIGFAGTHIDGVLVGSTGGSGNSTWGAINGTLANQTDLQNALNLKGNISGGNTWSGNQTHSGLIKANGGVSAASHLYLNSNSTGDVILFSEIVTGGDGNDFRIVRKYNETGDFDYVSLFIDQYRVARLRSDEDIYIHAGTSSANKNVHIQDDADGDVWFFNGAAEGDNKNVSQVGYITSAGNNRYVRWNLGDTGRFALSREDANVTKFSVLFPFDVVGNTTISGSVNASSYLGGNTAAWNTAYSHVSTTSNPHAVTKAQVGLGNVNNTSDEDKPLSTASINALANKSNTTHDHAATYQPLDADLTQLAAPGNWKLFYSNSTGTIIPFSPGNANQVLISQGATSAPTWGDQTGGGTASYEFGANIFNGSGDFNTTGQVKGSTGIFDSLQLNGAGVTIWKFWNAAHTFFANLTSGNQAKNITINLPVEDCTLLGNHSIGSTVQAYNANTANYEFGANNFNGTGNFTTPGKITGRIITRTTSISSSATPTINTDNCEFVDITAIATAITSMTTNLSGTPVNGQRLMIRFKDNGTAQTIAWGTSYEAVGVALPTTTVISKRLTVNLIYDTTTSKWGCVATAQES